MKNKELLTNAESAALRGIAILAIILHNYCHFFGLAVKENEYTFTADRPLQLMDKLINLDANLFIHVFSFFGHYGVPIFLFISGFGLVMKYERASLPPFRQQRFISYHFLKLFRLMILGYLVFIVVYCIRNHNGAAVYSWKHVVAQLSMTINFLYFHPDQIIKPGPYWFFGLMLQLYIIYVLVIRRWRNNAVLLALVVAAFLLQWACKDGRDWLNYVRYNFIGGLLPFCMGVYYARYGRTFEPFTYLGIAFVSAVCVLMGSFWFTSWLWVPLFVVTGAVATAKLLPQWLLNPCAWFGALSSALFVMHPVVREVVLAHYRRIDVGFGILVYLLTAVALSMLLNYILSFIPRPKLK